MFTAPSAADVDKVLLPEVTLEAIRQLPQPFQGILLALWHPVARSHNIAAVVNLARMELEVHNYDIANGLAGWLQAILTAFGPSTEKGCFNVKGVQVRINTSPGLDLNALPAIPDWCDANHLKDFAEKVSTALHKGV